MSKRSVDGLSRNQQVVTSLTPQLDATTDIGSATRRFRNIECSGTINNLTLPSVTDQLVSLDTTDTLSHKTLILPQIVQIATDSNRSYIVNVPLGANDTLVGMTTLDTLTNKTPTSPIVNDIVDADVVVP